MTTTPIIPTIILALILFGDALLSLKPVAFIDSCLRGVQFPQQWWWALIYIKLLATIGLILGLFIPGFGIAVMGAIVAYFFAAIFAHIRAKFMGTELWINCLGMLLLSIGILLYSLL